MSDIVERLRSKGRHYADPAPAFVTDPLCEEAADEIERLRGLLREARVDLQEYSDSYSAIPATLDVIARIDAALTADQPNEVQT